MPGSAPSTDPPAPADSCDFKDPAGAVTQGVVRIVVAAIHAAFTRRTVEGLAEVIAPGQRQLYDAIGTLCGWILAQQLGQRGQSGKGRPIENTAQLLMSDLGAAMRDVGIEASQVDAVWARYFTHYYKPDDDPDTQHRRLTRARKKARGQTSKKARGQKSG